MSIVVDRKTNRFYIGFSFTGHPIWSEQGKVSQALRLPEQSAMAVVRQIRVLSPDEHLEVINAPETGFKS